MNDQGKAKQLLLEELTQFRRRVTESEVFRSLFLEASVGTVVTTPSGQIIQANRAFCDFLGYSESEFIGQTVLSITYPEDRESSSMILRQSMESRTPIQRFEKRYLHKSGQVLWGEISSVLICDAQGKPSYFIAQVLEITERKRAEESLRQSEERYRQLVDSTPDVIYILDKTGKLLYANRVAGAYFGVSSASLVGKTQHDLFPPEKATSHVESIQRCFETGNITDSETLYCFGDREVWLNVRSIPLRDKHGQITSLMGICRDITNRKQAEDSLRKAHDELEERVKERTSELTATNKTLRESEEKFRRLIEVLPDGVVECALTGHITYASRQILQMYGTDNVEEIMTKDPLEFFVPADHQKFFDSIQKTLDEGVTRDVPYECIKNDGTHFFGEASATAIKDSEGKPLGFVAILRDVTERKQVEETLRQSHDELRAIHDGMVEGLLVTNIETHRLLRANASICRMLGYSETELLSLSIEDLHPAEALPFIMKNIGLARETDHTHPANIPLLRKDGSVLHTEVVGKSLIYDGKPCSMGIFRDITERLQAQEALEQERQLLWKMLQASDHERQIISYDIHDGLAQYLAAAGMGFQAYDSMKENSPEEARKAYEMAVELVRQAHSESRRLIGEVRHPVIDERGLATAIVSLAYEQQQRGGPRIECHASVEFNRLQPILENALYRMAQEALTNACKHSKSKKVTVSMIQEGRDVRLEVQDWGTGFDTQAIEKGHFGLESIRQRVRLLGGQLTIKSKPGSGTLVQVVVPILEKEIQD